MLPPCGVWIFASLPGKGVSAYEMMELIHQGVIKSLFVMGSIPSYRIRTPGLWRKV